MVMHSPDTVVWGSVDRAERSKIDEFYYPHRRCSYTNCQTVGEIDEEYWVGPLDLTRLLYDDDFTDA